MLGILLGFWALARPVTNLATVVAWMVVSCLWGGDTNTWGVRLSGTLLVGIVGGGRSTNDHLLMGVWGTVLVVAGVVDDSWALMVAGETARPSLLLLLLLLVLAVTLLESDSTINDIMIRSIEVVG